MRKKIKAKLKSMHWVKRTLIITSFVIVTFVAVVIIFFSPIAKYLIEKYDIKYLGREVKTGIMYANPFTGTVRMGNLRLYELKSNKVFISGRATVNFNMTKLFSGEYIIEDLTFSNAKMYVVQTRKNFNFNDIIDKFTPKEKKLVKKARTKLSILNINIENAEIHYQEKVIPVDYYIKEVNLFSEGMHWDRDTMNIKFSFSNGPASGKIKGNFKINLNTKDYALYVNIKKFDLRLLEQYLHDMANYGHLAANLDADVHASGNVKALLSVKAKGLLAINDFHFGKTPDQDFLSFDKLLLQFREVNPQQYKYYLDSVIIDHPMFVYETYDYLDNLQRMFGEGGSKIKEAHADSTKYNLIIEIAKSVQQFAKNFLESYYKIDRVALYRGDLKFNDYSPREKFAISLNPLYLHADSINKNHERIYFQLRSDVKPYGTLKVNMNVDPNDYQYFDADYNLQKIPIPLVNPYLITYTSFPLDRGSLEFNGNMSVQNGNINSFNHLVILDPRVGKRIRKKDTKWIPVPLIMAFVRERGNVIDYHIPVTGDLKNPKIHFKDIIFDLLKNIFVKPPTTPYSFTVKNVENEIEKSLTLKWEMRQTVLRREQEKFVDKIADFLKSNRDASITVQPVQYAEKEKEYTLFYEAKKKYFLIQNHKSANQYSEDDSVFVEKMSVKDSGFVHYLKKQFNDNDYYTIQQKCLKLIG
ncbi:MAG: hypothetical protein JWN78_2306, partial [Bacteroidota bacterium]|nr:hypothetical protein [Bacteroidota bacterium]